MSNSCNAATGSRPTTHPFFACARRARIWLLTLIVVQLALYGWLYLLSWQFSFGSPGTARPLLTMLAILAAAVTCYLISIPPALRLSESRRWMAVMLLAAAAMRLVVVFSEPIQEVDLYRYLWDGAVSSQGVSPYRFTPWEVRYTAENIAKESLDQNNDLHRLARYATEHDGLRETLNRVHYGELPTVYPPVSQAVFWIASALTPQDADIGRRVFTVKSIMVLFDLGVMLLVLCLLSLLRLNLGWFVAYGWSPLVIKEFANSGHLDSIAVFFCMASLVSLAAAFGRDRRFGLATLLTIAAALFFGLGVGAKLYPVILLPLIGCFVWRRGGVALATGYLLTSVLVMALTLAPMVSSTAQPTDAISSGQTRSLQGLSTFLTRWEINDLLFMIIQENLRPEGSVPGQPPLWFVHVPDGLRSEITRVGGLLVGNQERTPFLLARLLTTAILAAIIWAQCLRIWRDPNCLFESAFLVIAWLWLLSPTQNPWYWSWALPLVAFARSRLWLLMSGLTLIYYSRFWFEYHHKAAPTWGTPYGGVAFFDFVVVWFEFAPFLLLLALAGFVSNRSYRTGSKARLRSST